MRDDAEECALECDALLDYLASAPEEVASLSEIDGILTAVAIGPEDIPSEEWLRIVWGDVDPQFSGEDQRKAVLGAFNARLEEILRTLITDPPTFAPLIWEADEESEPPDAGDWCYGFMVGVGLRLEAWRRFLKSEDADVMEPIYAYLPEQAEAMAELSPAERNEVLSEAADFIPLSVAYIYQHFFRKRMGKAVRAEAAARPARPERNAPCPCGSGAKYKKCCGAAV